jgi:hypothetical protein
MLIDALLMSPMGCRDWTAAVSWSCVPMTNHQVDDRCSVLCTSEVDNRYADLILVRWSKSLVGVADAINAVISLLAAVHRHWAERYAATLPI